jgi:hypothetical protein
LRPTRIFRSRNGIRSAGWSRERTGTAYAKASVLSFVLQGHSTEEVGKTFYNACEEMDRFIAVVRRLSSGSRH